MDVFTVFKLGGNVNCTQCHGWNNERWRSKGQSVCDITMRAHRMFKFYTLVPCNKCLSQFHFDIKTSQRQVKANTLAIFKLCEYTVTTVIHLQRPWTVKMSKQHLTFICLWVQDYIFKQRRQILCKISHWQVWLAVWFLYQEVNKWSWSCLNWLMYCALVHKSLRLLQCSADVTKHCTMGLLFSTLLSVNFYVVNALNFLLRWATDIMTQSINQLKHDKVSRDLCCSSILSWSHHLETLQ